MGLIQFGCTPKTLVLEIHGRARPDSQDYWDANWLHCTATASIGVFYGKVEWQLRNEDLERFLRSLNSLDAHGGESLLETLDGWLDVRVSRNSLDEFNAKCQLIDDSDGNVSLEFVLCIAQKDIDNIKVQINFTLSNYPVLK